MTDTDKWKKPLLKSLPPEYKLLWLYITDQCDHAGIWDVEIDIAETRLGIILSEDAALEKLGDKVIPFDGGTKWFIPSFISFQYGDLNPKNKVHNSVLNILTKYNLTEKIEGLPSPLQGAKDKAKDKDKEKGGVGEIKTEQQEPIQVDATGILYAPNRPEHAPTFEAVNEFFWAQGKKDGVEAKNFFNHYEGLGWMQGFSAIFSWRSIANKWIANTKNKPQPKEDPQPKRNPFVKPVQQRPSE